MASSEYLDCELDLASSDQARLTVAGRDYSGRPALGESLRHRLLKASVDPTRYGSLLFEALFQGGGELLEGYHAGLAIARNQKRRLRFRLHIASSANSRLHDLHWELLYDPKQKLALGRSQDTAFSRYLSVPLEPGTAALEKPKLLVVTSQPTNLAEYLLPEIDTEVTRIALEEALKPLAGAMSYEFLEGPATIGRIRDRLHDGGFHVLHLQAHGLVNPEGTTASLVLEDEHRCVSLVAEDLFSEIIEGNRELRLVTLVACHSGAHTRADPFSGLGPALVRRGVPAVVAMRCAIRFEAARRFTKHLYVNLSRNRSVDTAVNEARLQLYLSDPERLEWSTPALYMRLPEGRLWTISDSPDRPPEVRRHEAGETETLFGQELNELRHRPSRAGLRRSAAVAALLLLVGLVALVWIRQETARPQGALMTFEFSVDHDDIHASFRQGLANRVYSLSLYRGLLPADHEPWGVFRIQSPPQRRTSVLPPGYYYFDQERSGAAIHPSTFQVGKDLPEALKVEIRAVGSKILVHTDNTFPGPVFLKGHGTTIEVNTGIVEGLPPGEYLIFSRESEKHRALRKNVVVTENVGRYEIDFLPKEKPMKRLEKPPVKPELPKLVTLDSPAEETSPTKIAESLSPGRSEANFNMLIRSVKIACQSETTDEGTLEPTMRLLQSSIDGTGKMPVLPEKRERLVELLRSVKTSGCEGFAEWVKSQE